jgi:hypothetical protein
MRLSIFIALIAAVLSVSAAKACKQVDGKRFESVDLRETGIGRYGASMGHWSVEFTHGKFSWVHADVAESGRYTCSKNKITGQAYGRTYSGEYFPKQGILIWMEMKYRPAARQKAHGE